MNTINTNLKKSTFRIIIQSDMGANHCTTDNQGIIVNYVNIPAYLVGGVEKDEVAVVCTGKVSYYGTQKKAS